MGKKTHALCWFVAGLGAMLAFAKYSNGLIVRAGVREQLTKEDEAKIKAQLRKEIEKLFRV